MKKSTIALIVAAFVCLGLSVFSVKASVVRTNDAIQNIGEVTYTEESKAKIDRAVKYYNALDPNFDLKKKIKNMNVFNAAKIEYARLAIKAASVADARKTVEGYSFDDVKKYVTEAREVIDSYLTADQYTLIENYADLIELESDILQQEVPVVLRKKYLIPMCLRKKNRRRLIMKRKLSLLSCYSDGGRNDYGLLRKKQQHQK